MHRRSASGIPGVGSVCLSTGRDSPVNDDSSTSSDSTLNRRQSAGTMSPDSIATTSPSSSASAAVSTVPSLVTRRRSEEHTSELQSLMRISYAVFCLKKKKNTTERNEDSDTKNTNNYIS